MMRSVGAEILRLSWSVRCSARVCVLVSEALKSYSSLSSEMPPVGRSEAQPDSAGAWLSRLLASARASWV